MANAVIPIALLALGALALGGGRKKKDDGQPPKDGEPAPPPPKDVTVIEVPKKTAREDGKSVPVASSMGLDGRLLPQDFEADSLWISPDCTAWAVGQKWEPKAEFEGDLVGPYTGYMRVTDEGTDPDDATFPHDTLIRSFARNVMRRHILEWGAECPVPPLAEDAAAASGDSDTLIAMARAYANEYPELQALFEYVMEKSMDEMDRAWREKYPDHYAETSDRLWAAKAAQKTDIDETDQTDWAYHNAYPQCPYKIDPSNPAHKECMEAWLRLRDYIREAS